ncbi:MAG TPA: hypothetical protein DCR27_05290 [Lachnospiraceae bacterium]|nr:hypothetical protein [Lachnospiraceae bacterium]
MEKNSKLDLSFLEEPFKEHIAALDRPKMLKSAGLDNMQGEMSIPEPMMVSANNGMTGDDYNACSSIVSACRNMIQQTITEANPGNEDKAILDMGAWVKGFLKFPFPIFNFIDYQKDHYKEDNFSFSADADVVDKILTVKGVPDLKDAVFAALHSAGEEGKLMAYSKKERDFEYFGIVNAYTQTDVFIRIIRFTMHMQNTEVQALCSKTQKTALDSEYVTYRFSADKGLMIKLQAAMNDGMVEDIAGALLKFIKMQSQHALDHFSEEVNGKK